VAFVHSEAVRNEHEYDANARLIAAAPAMLAALHALLADTDAPRVDPSLAREQARIAIAKAEQS
jgi:hypothetical protein